MKSSIQAGETRSCFGKENKRKNRKVTVELSRERKQEMISGKY